MDVTELIKKLKLDKWFNSRIAHIEEISPKDAKYALIGDSVSDRIKKYLERKRVRLYSHQLEVIKHIKDEKNVIITTPTASGKTLSFNIPVFEELINNPDATALYIYPTKALTNDQLKFLKEFEKETLSEINPAVYDGDTPQSKRLTIRENSRIVLMNPYELHQILPWHSKWGKFLSNLKFVIIDEAHRYRGVFGSNVSFLLRRLRRICSIYGSEPKFILSSATIANPIEFSQKLVGLDFALVNEDGSPKGKKYFLFYNPYYDGMGLLSVHEETKNLFITFLRNNFQTLCFTVSRRMAEVIAKLSKDELKESDPELYEKISPYRAGYLAEERRIIENKLKFGQLCGVVSTNALEIGIDIGSLDSVIISGYPGTVISTWQQAGRAGRGLNESIATLIAFQNPLDQYFMKHPEDFFKKAHEHAIIDIANPYILSGQILCASSEFPIKEKFDKSYFGDDLDLYLKTLDKEKIIKETDSGWVYVGTGRAVDAVKLDTISNESYKVSVSGYILETMDRTQAYREAHPGAVLIHLGETYLVDSLDLNLNTAYAKKAEVDYYTEAIKNVDITVIGKIIEKKYNEKIDIILGEVDTKEEYFAYNIKRYDKIVGRTELNLPVLTFNTVSFWFEIPNDLRDRFIAEIGEEKYLGGIHAIEHAMIGILPIYVLCDRWDIGGFSTQFYPQTGKSTIFIYDGYEGGIGLSEKAFELFDDIALATYNLIKDCSCKDDNGCPACIQSPKCGNDNKPLSKIAALKILESIIKLT